jgi:hypothetical protein
MIGNLLPGDQIKIDGESDYRTITSIPRFAFTKSYNNGDYVQNSMYAKAGTTNYEGGTDGVGLSVTANVNQYGEITTLSVSDIEFNKRDLQLFFDEGILLQPTAYGYFTTPVVHFIPVDGNGGGAKAEVIAYGGQILDVVLTDGGSGYTQPPKVVVARRYKRIKQSNRKIDSLSILNIQTDIASSFEMVAYSVVRIEGGPFSPQAISSIITFGGFDPELNTDRDIITTVNTLAGEERQVRMTDRKFPTEARVQSPTVELQYVQPFVEPYITTITGGIIGTESIVTLQSAAREITKIVQIKANKAFRQEKADSINGVGTFLDAPMDLDDTIAYVGNATGFPDTPSRLRIGREVVYYKNRESDRFLNLTRGYEGSPIENHAPGELVLHYPEFLTLLSGGIETILSEGSVAQSSITSIEHTTTFESFSEVKSNDTRNIELTNQVSIEHINTVQDVIEEIIIIPRDSYNIVTEIHTTVSQVRKATAGVNDVDGFVVIADVRNSEVTELLLTQENQIEIDNTNVITYLSIADVSATASVSTQIVTSNYESTVITVQNQIQEITTLLAYTSEIINDVQSNIYSASNITSVKINTVDAYVSSKVNISSSSEDLLKPIYLQTEVTATVADINTFATTVAMIIGTFGAGSSSSTERDYRSAVVDYIIEDYVLEPTIKQRGGFVVILDDPYNEVIYRDGSTFFVENNNQKSPPGFEDYTLGNVGLTLGSFESNALVATGVNSGLTIYDIDFLYPTLVIRDFDTRSQSAFTSTGDVFNLAIPSYQTPVAISTSSGTIGGPITVQTTEYFNNSGYLITSGGTVISYTSKTSNTFEGCTLVNGPDLISPNDELIPFTIV